MDLSSAVPGDRIKISLEGKSNEFEVIIAEPKEIIISPVGNPSSQSGLFLTSIGWKVVGAENVPYQITKIPKPEVSAPAPAPKPTSPKGLSDDSAAQICSRLILNPKAEIPDSEFQKLVDYSATTGFGRLEDNLRSKRDVCEKILQKVVQQQNPDLNVQRINVQNLARQYQAGRAKQIEQQIQEEKEAQLRAEKEEKEQEIKRRQSSLVRMRKAHQEAIQDRVNFIRKSAIVRSRCLRSGKFSYGFSNYQIRISPELFGRRVLLPENQWAQIFSEEEAPLPPGALGAGAGEGPVNLIENPLIQEALAEIIGPDFLEMGLDNRGIVELIGEDIVSTFVPEYRVASIPPQAQYYLKVDISEPIYAIIQGPHFDGENILYVSEQLSEEFKRINNPKVTRVTDCSLNPIKELNIELLRFPDLDIADVSEDVLKNLLIDRIGEYGILVAGDILKIPAENITFQYLVKKIINTDNSVVYAAGAPQIIQTIQVQLDVQSKDQVREMIETRFAGEIDPKYL